jgi:hypothetical protein
MNVYVQGQLVRLDPRNSIGKGGEADVFKMGSSQAVKIFKPSSHPDFVGQDHEKHAAEARLKEHQTKLREFPKGLPPRVITPMDLATDKSGRLIKGYVMPLIGDSEVLLRYGERKFRQGAVGNDIVVNVFTDMHSTLSGIHAVNVVAGDFNDLNILVTDQAEAFFIDADSFQFGSYLCRMFTGKFVDPLLCDPKHKSPMLNKPHNAESDWYSFAIMLMQSLLFVGPYGGIYRPKDKTKRMTHDARPLHRVTIFDPEVKYPKPATPYGVLPDDLLQQFYQIFVKDQRGQFPLALLEGLRWTTCSACGAEHARAVCPECSQATPAVLKEKVTIRGTVTSTRVFKTHGTIVYATVQNGKLRWLCHESNELKRENGSTVVSGKLNPKMRFRIQGNNTLIGQTGQLAVVSPGNKPAPMTVDNLGVLPMFDANGDHHYWLQNGQLMRDDRLGTSKIIGDVLENQTMFWAGDKFGFGFYRAGELCRAFIFDAKKPILNDSVKLPHIKGQMVDATCCFSNNRIWFLVSTRQGGKTINQCLLFKSDGTLVATAEAEEGDDSWLSTIRGKCAAGDFMLAATEDGLVRIEANGSGLSLTKEFPDTEPFVHSGCRLFASQDGLSVIDSQEIRVLKIT